MKIIHLNASDSGGAFVVAQRLSEALNAIPGIQSNHLVYDGKKGNYTVWADNFVKRKIAFGLHALEKLDFLRYEKNKAIRFAFSHGKTGIDITKHPLIIDADVIHLHWINKGFLSLKNLEQLLATGKKVVWTCHDMWAFTGGCYHNRGCENYLQSCGNCKYLKNPKENDLSNDVFKTKKRLYSKYPNLSFVTPSHWLAEMARNTGMHIENEIDVCPNGIDTNKFKFYNNKLNIRKELNWKDVKTVLFISGNLSNPFKGFKEFISAMKLLVHSIPELQIVVVGSRIPDIDFEGLNMIFAGSIGDELLLSQYYNAADVYITTSLEENLPTTVIESMACGTPVVAFNVGGTADIIDDSVNGYLVTKGDIQDIAKKTEDILLLNIEKYQSISQKARRKAVETFEINIVALETLRIYNL